MITIEPTRNYELIKQILTTPILFEEIKDDGGCNPEDFIPNPSYLYLLAKKEDEILGIIFLHDINSVCAQGHVNILPQFWGKRYDEAVIKSLEWLKNNTHVKKVIASIPEDCLQVREAAKRWGFIQEGFSPKSVKRRGRLQGQYLLGTEI